MYAAFRNESNDRECTRNVALNIQLEDLQSTASVRTNQPHQPHQPVYPSASPKTSSPRCRLEPLFALAIRKMKFKPVTIGVAQSFCHCSQSLESSSSDSHKRKSNGLKYVLIFSASGRRRTSRGILECYAVIGIFESYPYKLIVETTCKTPLVGKLRTPQPAVLCLQLEC